MIYSEKIKKVIKISGNEVSLLGGGTVKLGAKFYSLANSLSLLKTFSGAGGIDSGAVANLTFYYVYVVISGGNPSLVASTSNEKPVGFSLYKKVGAFYTDSSSNIFKTYSLGEINNEMLSASFDIDGIMIKEEGGNWVNGNCSKLGTGSFSCPVAIDQFAEIPTCFLGTTSRRLFSINAVSVTEITLTMADHAGTVSDSPFQILCKKQGIDAVQPDWNHY